MYKQIIIARKDLNMSPGKLATQVSHASMAFLTNMIRRNARPEIVYPCFNPYPYTINYPSFYTVDLDIDRNLFEQWIDGEFTKYILEAKNKNQLLKAKKIAEDWCMREGIDFFLIKDNFHTELDPEEDGRTLTCIGFRPMDSEVLDRLFQKYQLYE